MSQLEQVDLPPDSHSLRLPHVVQSVLLVSAGYYAGGLVGILFAFPRRRYSSSKSPKWSAWSRYASALNSRWRGNLGVGRRLNTVRQRAQSSPTSRSRRSAISTFRSGGAGPTLTRGMMFRATGADEGLPYRCLRLSFGRHDCRRPSSS